MTSHNKHSEQFHHIKAVFEGFNTPHIARPTAPRASRASESHLSPTNSMPEPQRRPKTPATLEDRTRTIDSVIEEREDKLRVQETPDRSQTRSAPLQPLSSQRPSWIGPLPLSRPTHSNMSSMSETKQKSVTITYTSPGLQPPVYVTTSISEPAWEPIEMDATPVDGASGEHTFSKKFDGVQEGEYQYKFRLGPGDWWVCDESKPTIDDGSGNKNNVLVLESDPEPAIEKDMTHQKREDSVIAPTFDTSSHKDAATQQKHVHYDHETLHSHAEDDELDEYDDHFSPLLPHESHSAPKLPSLPSSPKTTRHEDEDSEEYHDYAPQSPLLRHETLFYQHSSPKAIHPTKDDHDDFEQGPLLRHESLKPESEEETQAPLFRHESIAIDNLQSTDLFGSPLSHKSKRSSMDSLVCPEADPNDPSLERFPTDSWEIMDKIRRAESTIPEDETTPEVLSPSPSRPGSLGSLRTTPSLPSLREEDEDTENGADSEPAHWATSLDEEEAPVLPRAANQDADAARHLAPITPPLTPIDKDDKKMHLHEHHHNPEAMKDMHEEAMHPELKHHGQNAESGVEPSPEKKKGKGFFTGAIEVAMGLGLAAGVVALGVMLAFTMNDAAKDGGAAVAGS